MRGTYRSHTPEQADFAREGFAARVPMKRFFFGHFGETGTPTSSGTYNHVVTAVTPGWLLPGLEEWERTAYRWAKEESEDKELYLELHVTL